MKSQIELAKEKGIEVGDRVKVVRKYEGDGWRNSWVAEMNSAIGGEFKIGRINEDGIGFSPAFECDFDFPVQSLEKVEESPKYETTHTKQCSGFWPTPNSPEERRIVAAIVAHGLCVSSTTTIIGIPANAVKLADALIAELNKGEG